MKTKRRLIGLLAGLAAAATLSACGGDAEKLTCGAGTQAQDGACVLTEDGCAEGTKLAEDGTCIPEAGACADGTTYDAAAGKCVVDTDITCGEGTVADDGTCVPEVVCGPGTVAEGGNCVVSEPTSCGPNTERDANSGECIITDTACVDGTAYDADTDSCAPTDQICDAGTHWSADTSMCMPDAQCQPGHVIVGGFCMTPAEELADGADLVARENDDPWVIGNPNTVALKPVGEQFVFTGTIEEPSNIDNDPLLTKEQDRDVFMFEANAGDFLQIGLQSTGLPAPGFKLESMDGSYVRYSPFDDGAARQIMVPKTGTYFLSVLPGMVLESDGAIGPVGNPDWGYVGTIEKLAGPSSVSQKKLVDGTVSGEFTKLTDNLFEITDLPQNGLVEVQFDTISDDFDAELVVWGSEADAHYSYRVPGEDKFLIWVPDTASATVLFDWVKKRGPEASFSIGEAFELPSVAVGSIGADSAVTAPSTDIAADSEIWFTFETEADQVLQVNQDNDAGQPLSVELYGSDDGMVVQEGAVTAASASFSSNPYVYRYRPVAQKHALKVRASNAGTAINGLVVDMATSTPTDLGRVGPGDSVDYDGSALVRKQAEFVKLRTGLEVQFAGGISSDGNVRLELLEHNHDMVWRAYQHSDFAKIVPQGEYLMQVLANSQATGYNLNFDVRQPPIDEVEPNDTTADAMSVDIGRQANGSVNGSDTDVFSFTLASDLGADEVFFANVSNGGGFSFGGSYYGCALLDSAGNEIERIASMNKGCLLLADGLSAGTYFVEISAPSGQDLNYGLVADTMSATLEAEPNNDVAGAMATDWTKLTAGIPLVGQVVDSNDVDVFAITLPNDLASDEELRMVGTQIGPNGGFDVQWGLTDSSGNPITSGNLSSGKLGAPALTAGTYYLGVYWPNDQAGQDGFYKIDVSTGPATSGSGPK